MLEWLMVQPIEWVNPDGESTMVRFIHEIPVEERMDTVSVAGRDIDLIAFDEMGSELESLRLMEFNAQKLSEYDFDMTKLAALDIPK